MNEYAEPGELQNLGPRPTFWTLDRAAHYQALLEFVQDCCHPEGYGHALPAEVVRRAGTLVRLVPKESLPSPVVIAEQARAEVE